ncbi:MAG: SpoIIE family protein phosphatase, partial [Planctomycetota bacterium]
MAGDPSSQLKRARSIQLGMLPDVPTIPGLDFHVHYSACDELGGDFYDFVEVGPFELGIVVADVSGHGLDAALLMASAKKSVQIHGRGRWSPAETLQTVCEDLAAELPANMFITMFYGVLDLKSYQLRYASAGHNPPILLNPSREQKLTTLTAKGVVIGSSMKKLIANTLTEETVQLRDGDQFIVHTDGLTEAMSPDKAEYGDDRLHELLKAREYGSASELIQVINTDLESHMAKAGQSDDLTMLVLRCADIDSSAKSATDLHQTLPGNLAFSQTQVIGRDNELARLSDALQRQPWATIVAPVGMGKSALARKYARDNSQKYSDGVWVVDCKACDSVDAVARRIAEVMEFSPNSDQGAANVVSGVFELRSNTLIILDDIDKSGITGLDLDAWTDPDRQLQLIATSGVSVVGTPTCELGGLETPNHLSLEALDVNSALGYSAVNMLVNRAKRASSDFEVTPENVSDIGDICCFLRGQPLALEVVARQFAALEPKRIVKALRAHFKKTDALVAGSDDASSIVRTVQWTFELLAPDEQNFLLQLGVFKDGFFIEAMADVVKHDQPTVMLQRMVKFGAVLRKETPYGARFQVGGPLGEYAVAKREKLLGASKATLIQEHYESFIIEFASEWFRKYGRYDAGPYPDESECFNRIGYEYNGLLDVHSKYLKKYPEVAARCILCASILASVRDLTRDAFERLDQSLVSLADGPSVLRMQLTVMRALLSILRGDYKEGRKQVEAAKRLEAELPPTQESLGPTALSGTLHIVVQDYESTVKETTAAIEMATSVGDRRALSRSLGDLGLAQHKIGKTDQGLTNLKEAYRLANELNADGLRANALSRLMVIYREQGKFQDALKLTYDAEAVNRRTGNKIAIAKSFSNQGNQLLIVGQKDAALASFERASKCFSLLGNSMMVLTMYGSRMTAAILGGKYEYAQTMLKHGRALAAKQDTEEPKISLYDLEGYLNFAMGRLASARMGFEFAHRMQSEKTFPPPTNFPHKIGLLCALSGDLKGAEEWFAKTRRDKMNDWSLYDHLIVAVAVDWVRNLSKPDEENYMGVVLTEMLERNSKDPRTMEI